MHIHFDELNLRAIVAVATFAAVCTVVDVSIHTGVDFFREHQRTTHTLAPKNAQYADGTYGSGALEDGQLGQGTVTDGKPIGSPGTLDFQPPHSGSHDVQYFAPGSYDVQYFDSGSYDLKPRK